MANSTCRYQNWEVVDPEKWVPDGYVCVRIDSRGAGRSPGVLDIWSPRETRDFHDCIEWAAGAAVVQRQGRPQRHLVLRDEPVAGGGAPAAPPRRDLRLGGRRRLLPGSQPPRRDPLLLRPGVVPLAGHHAPARPRDPGPPEPDERGLDLRARDARRGGARGPPAGLLRGLPPESPRHRRVLALAPAGLLADHCPAPVHGELGRPGSPPARQLRGLHAGGVVPEVARGARRRALDALLHRTTASRSRSGSSATS